jgi:cysteine desulfurase/selenocysteine lyase
MGAACEYLNNIGMNKIFDHDILLGQYLYDELKKINSLTIYGPRSQFSSIHDLSLQYLNSENPDKFKSLMMNPSRIRTGLVSFNCDGIHPTDLSFFLDQEGVALRTGHHCTQPLHRQLNISASIRASIYLYNDKRDVDTFIEKLKDTINMFERMK